MPNFLEIGPSIAEILRFFKWPPPSWIFQITKLYWLPECRGLTRITVPNFVKIGQSVVEILQFFHFLK